MIEAPSFIHTIPEIPKNIPSITVDTAWAIDIDRTLSSVDAVVKRLADLGRGYGVPLDYLHAIRSKAKASNAVFDPLLELSKELNTKEYAELCAKFNDETLSPITYEDTARFLGKLTGPKVILTYALQAPLQRIKMRSIPYEGYIHILEHTNKGPVIESWKTEQQTYDFLGISDRGEPLALYHAYHINLVDDNSQSHDRLPPECTGYYIRRPQEHDLPEQTTPLGDNIIPVSSLDEIPGAQQRIQELQQPFAYIPLSEISQPLLWIGRSIVSSMTDNELRDRTA